MQAVMCQAAGEKPEMLPGWPQLHDGAGYNSASLGSFSVRLSSFCFAGKRSLLCPTVDFTACLAAGVSGQQTPANRSPEENAWFPIALTVTVIVLHVNRSKAGELRCVWLLS